MECYENLANAIIQRAVDDYIMAVRYLYYLIDNKYGVIARIAEKESKRSYPIHYTSTELQNIYERKVRGQRWKISDLEKFFHSSWYGVLTRVDGKRLLEGVKQQIKDKYNIDCDLL